MSSLVGQLVGPYRVLAQLGRGGMGEVYRAEHTLLGREVALKTIRPEMAERRSVLERFFNEARAVNAIGHPNIVDIHDVGRTPEGLPYCVMELLKGQSLHQLRKRLKRLEPGLAVHLAAQMADALDASHRAGIIHRDLKPQNVFVVERPENPHFIKVLDFGIAKLVGSASATSTGAVLGTPYYMAPEQVHGAKGVDHHADIYSLGAVLYELCTGRRPFTAETPAAVMIRHLTDPLEPPSVHAPDLPRALEVVIQRAMAKAPADRYASMSEMAGALRASLTVGPLPPALPEPQGAGRAGVTDPHWPPPAAAAVSARGASGAPHLSTSGPHEATLSSLSDAAHEIGAVAEHGGRQSSRWLVLGALAFAAGLGAVLLLTLRSPPPAATALSTPLAAPAAPAAAATTAPAVAAAPAAAAAPGAVVAPPVPPAAPAAEAGPVAAAPTPTLELQVTSTPSGAQVRRSGDGHLLGTTPAALTLERAGLPVELTVSLKGHQTRTLRWTEGDPAPLEVALEKRVVARGARRSRRPDGSASGTPPVPAAPAASAARRPSDLIAPGQTRRRGDLLLPGQAGRPGGSPR